MKTRLVPLGLVLLFAWLIGLRPGGGWYSPSWVYRLQTEAFLRGSLALQDTPHGQRADWAWGDGSQHVWGLGVPLLRLPFEALARLTGAIGFPDRLVLLFAFAAVLLVTWRAFADRPPWQRASLTALMLFPPAFVGLCQTRLWVYEEAVAYGFLAATLIAALLALLALRPRASTWLALATVAGAAVLVRPTLALHGLAGVAIGCHVVHRAQLGRKALAAGLVCFALGPLAAIATNHARFGDVFEVGQRLNVSNWPADQFAKAFGYPYVREPLVPAAIELSSALFLAGDTFNDFREHGRILHPGQSPTYRWRELYFTTFDALALLLLLAAWGALARRATDPRCVALGAWSALAFALQLGFYVRMPSLTSRYLVDFAPAVAAALAAGLLLALRLTEARPRAALALSLLGLGFVGFEGVSARAAGGPAASVDAAAVRAELARPRPEPTPLPYAYRCGDSPAAVVPFNGAGWDTPGTCLVQAGTTLYLPTTDCVRVRVEPPADLSAVRVKRGLTELERVDELTFCAPPGAPRNPRGIEIVYFGWIAPARLDWSVRPFKLLGVEATD